MRVYFLFGCFQKERCALVDLLILWNYIGREKYCLDLEGTYKIQPPRVHFGHLQDEDAGAYNRECEHDGHDLGT